MNYRQIPLALLAILAVASLAVMEQPPAITGGPFDVGDTAWLLTATGLVLLMTPGLSFFYGGMVSTKNVISTFRLSATPTRALPIARIGRDFVYRSSRHINC